MNSRNKKNKANLYTQEESGEEGYPVDESEDDYKEEILSEEDEIAGKDELANITSWGNKKNAFYEQEKGKDSDEELEDEEEEEAKLIEKLQTERLAHQDFFDEFAEEETGKKADADEEGDVEINAHQLLKNRLKEMEGLADNEKIKFVKSQSPELANIVNELKASIREIKYKLIPVINYAKIQKALTKETNNYLDARLNLLSTYCIHLSFYILLKVNGKTVQDHPVIQRIVKLKNSLDQLKPLNKMLEPQINKILRMGESLVQTSQEKTVSNGKKSQPSKSQNILGNSKTATKSEEKTKKALNKIDNEITNKKSKGEKIAQKGSSNGVNMKRKLEVSKMDKTQLHLDDSIGSEDDDDSDDGEDEYYRQVKKLKEAKRNKIQQEKQEKLAEDLEEDPSHYVGDEDVRAINRKILKNKGLVRRRKKIDRNSRVKLRHKYEKALIKQKSKGHHYRENKNVYEGEMTGVKSGLIRSTKLRG